MSNKEIMKPYRQPFPQAITFFVLLIINTLTASIYNLCNEIWLLMPIRLGAVFINGMGITLITVLFLWVIRKYLHINLTPIVYGIALLVMLIEIFLLMNFYTLITPSVVMVTLDTNNQEASEFFTSYFNLTTCTVLFLVIVVIFIGIRFRHRISRIEFPLLCLKPKFLITICCITLAVYVGFTYYVTQIRHMTSYQALTGVERVWHSVKNTLNDRKEYNSFLQLIGNEEPILIEKASRIPPPSYVVLVLGESHTKLHMNAYGYPLSTTPLLNQRIEKGETVKFNHVTAAKTITSLSIRQIMTFNDDNCPIPWYQCHTLPAVMRQSGYKTYWLSNQDSFTNGDNNSTAAIASTSDIITFAHQRHSSEERYGYFDGDLLPLLDREMERLPSKAFFCFHLMGSHRRYTNRYPSKFSKFGIEDIDKDVSREKKRTISEYDNSVLYNDYVVDEIIKRFENKDAIIFYFPDHGEEVYDNRNMSGHGLENPTYGMTNIPFTIWTSEVFKNNHPEIAKQINLSANKPFCTADFIHTIMDICGIKTKDYQAEKSLFYMNNKGGNNIELDP